MVNIYKQISLLILVCVGYFTLLMGRVLKGIAIFFILLLCYLLTKAEQEYINDEVDDTSST
jgi:hypothetical protein